MLHRFIRTLHDFRQWTGDQLRRFGDAVAWPVERVVAGVFGRLIHATEGFERIEDWLIAFVRLITWPIRMLYRLIASVIPPLLARFPGEKLLPADAGEGRFVHALINLVELLNLDGAVRGLVWITQPAWRPIAAVLGFGYEWLATRPYRQMLWGLPALLLLAPIGGAAAWGVLWGRGEVLTNYRLAFKKAREDGDYQRMELFERKLAQLGDDTQRTAFSAAAKLAEDGQLNNAFQRMRQLAPADNAGYLPAHFWLLERLVAKELPLSDEERLELTGQHLDRLEAARIRSETLQLLRAGWLVETGKQADAAALLKPLVHRSPAAAVQRMVINLNAGESDEARKDASAVTLHYRERSREDEAITAEEYRLWVIAEEIVGDGGAQAKAVQAWAQDFPEDESARQAQAAMIARQAAGRETPDDADAPELVDQINKIAALDADPRRLQPLLAKLLAHRRQSPAAQAAVDSLAQSSETHPNVLQLIGTAYLIEGDAVTARPLLKRATEKNPQDAVAWNNYACSLMELPDGDMGEALTACEKAVAIAPDSAHFQETFGQVLIRLQQWQPAIEHLEVAMNGMPESKAIHRSLALAYGAIGESELAAIHRQQAE